ncbi:Elicitin [Phytophthora infestans]|uniref:Elicitin n=1 Tax=Phytophthora infestans TaxID=4787 RepID=A0A8S9UGT7_PHYIN|nr:Elicitin [Phytophthora infestans]
MPPCHRVTLDLTPVEPPRSSHFRIRVVAPTPFALRPMAQLSRFAFTFATSTLLLASVASVEDEGVTFNVSTLFDVLNFTDSEFLMFCNSSTCLGPVHEMIHSIPSDCLILYEGTERNLSKEVKALHDECHRALGTDDDDDDATDSDDMPMSMSGMKMDGTTSSTSGGTTGSSAASAVSVSLVAAAVSGCTAVAALV